MTKQKYIASGTQACVWHYDQDCKMAHTTQLVPVEDEEIPNVATRCTNCADGFTANDIENMGDSA